MVRNSCYKLETIPKEEKVLNFNHSFSFTKIKKFLKDFVILSYQKWFYYLKPLLNNIKMHFECNFQNFNQKKQTCGKIISLNILKFTRKCLLSLKCLSWILNVLLASNLKLCSILFGNKHLMKNSVECLKRL